MGNVQQKSSSSSCSFAEPTLKRGRSQQLIRTRRLFRYQTLLIRGFHAEMHDSGEIHVKVTQAHTKSISHHKILCS